jgi:predicted secreted hydrolase
VRIRAFDRERSIGLELDLVPQKPLVLHGQGGVSVKGPEPGNASAYMSWTRLETRGRITFAGDTLAVRGESWFDHEWGSSQLGEGVVGWDWFGLRLDDGRELMLYRLRDENGNATAASSATLVERDGRARTFASREIAIEVRARAARYPTRWSVRIAAAALDLDVAAEVEDCEIDGRASTGVTYWEGPVAVTGSHEGRGYAELTGYAESIAARF